MNTIGGLPSEVPLRRELPLPRQDHACDGWYPRTYLHSEVLGCAPMEEPEGTGIAIRADLHALDAALAEHRRALALAASRRETERMARMREVKAAAQAAAEALEQPVQRPMRGVRLAQTWVEV